MFGLLFVKPFLIGIGLAIWVISIMYSIKEILYKDKYNPSDVNNYILDKSEDYYEQNEMIKGNLFSSIIPAIAVGFIMVVLSIGTLLFL